MSANEPVQNGGESPQSQPPAGPAMPKIDVTELIKTAMAVAMKPAAFFDSIREEKGYEKPLIFAVAMGAVAGVVGTVVGILHLDAIFMFFPGWGNVFSRLLLWPIAAALGMFLGGGLLHVIVLILGGKANYETSARIAGYSAVFLPAAQVVSWLPIVSVVPSLYALYIAALAVIALHQTERQKTFIVFGVIGLLGLALAVWSFNAARSMSHLERDAAQWSRELEKSGTDLGKAMEEMGKQMQRGKN